MNTHIHYAYLQVCVYLTVFSFCVSQRKRDKRTNSKHKGDRAPRGYTSINLQSGTGNPRKYTPYRIFFRSDVDLFYDLSEDFVCVCVCVCVCVRIGRSSRKFRETHNLQVNSTSIKFTVFIRFQGAAAAGIVIDITAMM
jgi:hypothetical protein